MSQPDQRTDDANMTFSKCLLRSVPTIEAIHPMTPDDQPDQDIHSFLLAPQKLVS
jgi:hypothetical protein